jgi:hypothetical protein
MTLPIYKIMIKFNEHFKEQKLKDHGNFHQNIGWYSHCCPIESKTFTLNFLTLKWRQY